MVTEVIHRVLWSVRPLITQQLSDSALGRHRIDVGLTTRLSAKDKARRQYPHYTHPETALLQQLIDANNTLHCYLELKR